MDFIDQIKTLAGRIPKQLDHIQTEEATKSAFIMPFINALGYDVFDPTEVVPEYTADIGTKKGEKVDYAILQDGNPIMLFECKWCGSNLDEVHASQLYRYFNSTPARIGVLTNGIVYKFYSDLEAPNVMDKSPFLVFDMRNIQEALVTELKKLTKNSFDLEEMLSAASDLKYTREIKRILKSELSSPSEAFVRFFVNTKKVYSGKMTQAVREQFTDIVERAFRQFINERINERLQSALSQESSTSESTPPETEPEAETEAEQDGNGGGSRIKTTEEELEAYLIVKTILREVVDPNRIVHRDTISYMGILLDDNRLKTICRLFFNAQTKKYIGLFDENKNMERVEIENLNDIYQYSDKLKATVGYYDD